MNLNFDRRALRPEQVWLLLAALALIALAVCAAVLALGVYARGVQALDQIGPRYARISGLLQKQAQIQQAGKVLETSLTQYVYPATGDASQIGNQVLQKVRDLASARELRVASSQTQPAKEDKDHPGLDRIAINLRIDGEWSAMQGLLADLARQTPAIYLNTLQETAQGGGQPIGPKAQLLVGGQFDLYVLQAHKASDVAGDASAASAPPSAVQGNSLLSGGHPKAGMGGGFERGAAL